MILMLYKYNWYILSCVVFDYVYIFYLFEGEWFQNQIFNHTWMEAVTVIEGLQKVLNIHF